MSVYNMGNWSLSSISIDHVKIGSQIGFGFEVFYSGCGNEQETISFELQEMDKCIDYFRKKYQDDIDKNKEEKKNLRIANEEEKLKDETEYKRLCKKLVYEK